jgi:hypothetical protein
MWTVRVGAQTAIALSGTAAVRAADDDRIAGVAMDLETSAAIERVGERIDRLEHRIDALEATMRAEFSAVHTEFSAVRTEVSAVRTGLRAEFRDGLAEVRRHAEILHETLRDDIRMLAEGFATISVKLDAMQR